MICQFEIRIISNNNKYLGASEKLEV